MSTLHKTPFEQKTCIVSGTVTCRFFENPVKNEKSVFIVAPSSMKELTDVVKAIVKGAGYEPVMALDIREYNRSAFCNNICRPMLEAWIVIVIGDWKGNRGNVNVAFEHGIATAMGCEIVPVWIDGDEKAPFDISGLSGILIDKDWKSNSDSLQAFKKKFQEYFEKTSEKLELLGARVDVTKEMKNQLHELIQRFRGNLDYEDRRTVVALVAKMCRTNYGVYHEDEFSDWVIDVVVQYAHSYNPKYQLGVSLTKFDPDIGFLDLLKNAVQYNYNKPQSAVHKNTDFHNSLVFLAVTGTVPLQTRKVALECVFALGESIGDDKLLTTVSLVAKDGVIKPEDYESLHLGTHLKLHLERAIGRGPAIPPILDVIQGLRSSSNPVVVDRAERLLQELRK